MSDPQTENQSDVEALHRDLRPLPLRREAAEPTDGNEPAPWWLWALVVASIFIGGLYLGRHFGAFSAEPHIGFRSVDNQTKRPELARALSGAELYDNRCASCHQADAKGLAGAYPPLVGSEWVTGRPEVPVRIVLQGLAGPIEVTGQTYNGTMPTWGPMMKDDEIARVVTHIRSLSNASAVDAELVAKERAATANAPPLTADTLRRFAKELR